jgi:hypothetical protein
MTIVTKLETLGHKALTAVEHAAVRLVGDVATDATALQDVLASSPMYQTAWAAGQASAVAHGIPVVAIEDAFTAVMAAAQQFVTSLKQPAPVAPPAPALAAA